MMAEAVEIDDKKETVTVSTAMPMPMRHGVAGLALVLVFLVTNELWRGVWPINATTPLFALMILCIDLSCIALALALWFGPDEHWQFKRGELLVTSSLRTSSHQMIVKPYQISGFRIDTVTSDSGPDTYRLRLTLKGPRDKTYSTGRFFDLIQTFVALNFDKELSPRAKPWIIKSPAFSSREGAQNAYDLLIQT